MRKLETFCYSTRWKYKIPNEWETSLHHLDIVTDDCFGSKIFPNVKSVSICSTTPANLVSLETIFPAATQFFLIYHEPSERWTNVSQIMHDIQMHRKNVKITCFKDATRFERMLEDLWGSRWSSLDRNEFFEKGINKPNDVVSLKKDINGLLQWSTFDCSSSELTDLYYHHFNLDEFFANVSNA